MLKSFCLRRIENFSRFSTLDLLSGTIPSECQNPCVETEMKASLIKDTIIDSYERSFIYFNIDQTVDITEYFYPEFSISNFLSSVGGSLGLWLGIGVVQIGGYFNLAIRHFWRGIIVYVIL